MYPALVLNIYKRLPPNIREILRTAISYVPLTERFARRRFLRDKYAAHIRIDREHIFASCARFCTVNRPMQGYYFEFGCHSATTMRMAYDYFHHLFDWTYVAFDSFEGLPKISGIDQQEIWQEGKLATDEQTFTRLVTRHGMPREKLLTIKGFYDTSLTADLQAQLLPSRAAVIHIDCDLYSSTVPVLEFIRPFLQKGTILIFDDWNCFWADPNKGERRAFGEFRSKYPQLHFEEFLSTHMQKAFVYVGDADCHADFDGNATKKGNDTK